MPQHRKSFKHNIGDTVFVLWNDCLSKCEVKEITISGTGIYYRVDTCGCSRLYHESEVAKTKSALAGKIGRKQ